MLITYRRLLFTGLLILITTFVSGCWDRKEIENRGYVLGVAIDNATPEKNRAKDEFLYAPQSAGGRKYRVTMELPKFRKPEGGKEQSSAQQHLLWSGEGESMLAITRAINTKTYFGMFYEDIQSIVISEEVAKEGIGDFIDFFLRDAEIRRNVRFFVTPGRAEDVLKAKLQVEEVNSTFIAKLTRNVDRSPYFARAAQLGDIAGAIRSKRSFLIPNVLIDEKEVKLTGAAVFDKQQRMIGELDEFEVNGTELLNKKLKQGVIVVKNPAAPSKVAVYELYEADIKIVPILEGSDIRFKLEAKFIGTLGENAETKQDALDPVFVSAVEKAVADEYTRLVNKAYLKQQKLGVEVCGLGKLIYNKYPQYWKANKDRWEEEIFPRSTIDVKITATVRRPVLRR